LNFKGYDNSDEIVDAFADALDQSTPVCEGFFSSVGGLPDRAIVVYRGIDLDWNRFDLGENPSDGMTLQLFKLPQGWRLIYITPLNLERDVPHLGNLQACPAGSPMLMTMVASTMLVAASPTGIETIAPSSTSSLPEPLVEPSNQLNLAQMSVQEWSSTSPDGKWVAVGLVAFPKENSDRQRAYVRLIIFDVDGKFQWTIINDWQDVGLGFPIPAPLRWSQDGKHFYFTHRVVPDGCSAFQLLTDLQRVNLEDRTVDEILGSSALSLALAPDESRMAYFGQGDRGLVLKDIVTREEKETKIDPGKEFDGGNIVWSPDGDSFALTLAIHPCTGEYGLSKTVWAESTTILWVDATTLEQRVLIREDPRLFITVEWNEPDQILVTDGAENSLWHLDVNTGAIARP
jgi:hypothetical protein